MPATGTLKPGDATVKALSALLPSAFRGLRGVPGLAAAYLDRPSGHAELPFDVLPQAMREVLQPVAKALESELGLPLIVRDRPREIMSRLLVTTTLGRGQFLNAQAGALPPLAMPEAIRAKVAEKIAGQPDLSLDPNARPDRLVLSFTGEVASSFDALEVTYEDEMITLIDLTDLEELNREFFSSKNITTDMVAHAANNLVQAEGILDELGLKGRAYVKQIKGTTMVVLKGDQSLRTVLTGTTYKLRNPKMIQFAVGTVGRIGNALKSIAHVTLAVVAADAMARAYLEDEGAQGAIARFLTGMGISIAATAVGQFVAFIGASATTLVIGPFMAGALVTFGTAYGMILLDEKYGITRMLAESIGSIGPFNAPDVVPPYHRQWETDAGRIG